MRAHCPTPALPAGDCFTAAFAVGLLEGTPYQEAMRFASAAAALCIQVRSAPYMLRSAEAVGFMFPACCPPFRGAAG